METSIAYNATTPNPYNPYTTIGELGAIWTTDNVLICGDLKRNVRLCPGTTVRLENGKLVDCSADAPANMEVVACYGDTYNANLFLVLRNIKSGSTILYPVKNA